MLGIENRVASYFLEGEPATFYIQRRNWREGQDEGLTLGPTVIRVHGVPGDISDIDRRSASQVIGSDGTKLCSWIIDLGSREWHPVNNPIDSQQSKDFDSVLVEPNLG